MNESTPEPVSPTRHEILRWGLGRLVNLGLFVGAGVLLIVLLGIAQRVGWLKTAGETQSSSSVGSAEAVHTCPMHPQIRQPGLGDCPICGMSLVPATEGGADLDEFAVSIEPAQRRLANIKTVTVTEQPVSRQLQTIGSIEIDESRQATISSYIDGRLEKIYADYTGSRFRRVIILPSLTAPSFTRRKSNIWRRRKRWNLSQTPRWPPFVKLRKSWQIIPVNDFWNLE